MKNVNKTVIFALILLTGMIMSQALFSGKWPWQRRIGRNVEVHHKRQHKRVSPDMWPKEPKAPADVDLERFANALKMLCGEVRMPNDRSSRYAKRMVEYAQLFDADPFLIAGLVFDQSRCLPKTPDYEEKFGLSRIDVKMHAPHIRKGAYTYYVLVDGEWEKRSLEVDEFPFNRWKAAYPESNIYWTAAILRVFREQKESLMKAFPRIPYRHHVSNWLFGDNVRSTEPEDRILTARRRMLEYYFRKEPARAGSFNGVELVSPLDGVPRMILDDFGRWRGDKKTGHIHQGIDLVAESDEPIRAMADGKVIFAGVDLPGAGSRELTRDEAEKFDTERMGPGGLYVMINHGDGFRTCYMHMKEFSITTREEVHAGDAIGKAGRTGAATSGAHLHLEFRMVTERLDPAEYMRAVLVDPKKIKTRKNAAKISFPDKEEQNTTLLE